mmetsp:Transcript_3034/g.4919  ORF Transcript_3034/g.4919 Transcript_3034/m.4919 type:complete len:252 (+) Transcript_3034:1334-2089(+)
MQVVLEAGEHIFAGRAHLLDCLPCLFQLLQAISQPLISLLAFLVQIVQAAFELVNLLLRRLELSAHLVLGDCHISFFLLALALEILDGSVRLLLLLLLAFVQLLELALVFLLDLNSILLLLPDDALQILSLLLPLGHVFVEFFNLLVSLLQLLLVLPDLRFEVVLQGGYLSRCLILLVLQPLHLASEIFDSCFFLITDLVKVFQFALTKGLLVAGPGQRVEIAQWIAGDSGGVQDSDGGFSVRVWALKDAD